MTDRHATAHRIQPGRNWPQLVLAKRAQWIQTVSGDWEPVTSLFDTSSAARRAPNFLET